MGNIYETQLSDAVIAFLNIKFITDNSKFSLVT